MPFQVVFSRSQFNFFPVTLDEIPDKTAFCGSTIISANLATDEFTFNALGEDFTPFLKTGELFEISGGNLFTIDNADATTDEFAVDTDGADLSSRYTGGFRFRVQGSPAGIYDGIWTAQSATFGNLGVGNRTIIKVAEDITTTTVGLAGQFSTSFGSPGVYEVANSTFSNPNVSVEVVEDIDTDLDPGSRATADLQWIKATLSGGSTAGHTYEWVLIDGPAVGYLSPTSGTLSGETEIFVIFSRSPFGNDERTFRLYIDRYTVDEQYDDVTFKGWPEDDVFCAFGTPAVSSSPIVAAMPKGGYGSGCRQLGCEDFLVTAPFPLAPHNGVAICTASSYFIGWNPGNCGNEEDEEAVEWYVEEFDPNLGWSDYAGPISADQRWYYSVPTGKSYRIRVVYDNKMGFHNFRGFSRNFTRSCSKWVDPANLDGIYAVDGGSGYFSTDQRQGRVTNYSVEILSQGSCATETDDVYGEFNTGKIEHNRVPYYFVELLTAGSCATSTDDAYGEFNTGKIEHSRVTGYSVVPLDGTDPGG